MKLNEIFGYFFIIAGIFFITSGVFGLFKFKDFYARILISSKIDTVGFLTLMAGVLIMKGFSMFSMKVLVIVVICIVINPVITHTIVRSAYYSGYMDKKEDSGG